MLDYILKRIVQRYWTVKKLRSLEVRPGFFLVGSKVEPRGIIVFNLGDPKFLHLGDQLYYEPVIHALVDRGFDVVVVPTKPLYNYFESQGIKVGKLAAIDNNKVSVRIEPLALFDINEQVTHARLVVDFSEVKIDAPLGEALILALRKAFPEFDQSMNQAKSTTPGKPYSFSEFGVDLPPRSVIFSNYVDSGKFRMRKQFFRQLEAKASEMKASGHHIVHVGSANDKAKDKRVYDFVDLDLRGKTSPSQLIGMFKSAQVVSAVTFDNFIMHSCLMAGKACFVKFRGRFTRSAVQHHLDHVNPALAPPGSSLITYL